VTQCRDPSFIGPRVNPGKGNDRTNDDQDSDDDSGISSASTPPRVREHLHLDSPQQQTYQAPLADAGYSATPLLEKRCGSLHFVR
jgi:hypothetical protein